MFEKIRLFIRRLLGFQELSEDTKDTLRHFRENKWGLDINVLEEYGTDVEMVMKLMPHLEIRNGRSRYLVDPEFGYVYYNAIADNIMISHNKLFTDQALQFECNKHITYLGQL